jgi:selenide,water dikinase
MAELAQVLRHVLPAEDANALVDASTGDDAAVYLLDENRALVVTTDFFTPIVDDPYQFGQISAANALSDLYAMGARPLFALNLLAFPRKYIQEGDVGRIIQGGAEKAREAGIPILGGHSIDDAEPKYGLVAVGEVHPQEMVTNAGARVGQSLVLTKALGTGIIATAIKNGRAAPEVVESAVRSMATLNQGAAEAMRGMGVGAATDVTGFGLLGHLHQLLLASGVAARIEEAAIPFLPGAYELAEGDRFPGGSKRNLADMGAHVVFPEDLPEHRRLLLADAQTSGGLLLSLPTESVPALLERLRGRAPVAAVIGQITEGPPGRIQVV